MRYPVGTRVWVWLSSNFTDVDDADGYSILPGVLVDGGKFETVGRSAFTGDVVTLRWPVSNIDITAALIPGPTDDHRPLARQLERYARYATPTHPAKDTAK